MRVISTSVPAAPIEAPPVATKSQTFVWNCNQPPKTFSQKYLERMKTFARKFKQELDCMQTKLIILYIH